MPAGTTADTPEGSSRMGSSTLVLPDLPVKTPPVHEGQKIMTAVDAALNAAAVQRLSKDEALEGFHEGEGHGEKDRPGRRVERESSLKRIKAHEAKKADEARRHSQGTASSALGFVSKLKKKRASADGQLVRV